uniref:nuclear pore complex protein Nup107-like n=1 Tax=Styela clava TaxID=7725 RepID=UPI001939F3AA|nr:nuclear pore complex protein Nup107-like [Styela clava]
MDERNGSYIGSRRTRGLNASGLINSPSTMRDARSMQRRSRMTPQQYQSLQQLDESIVQENPAFLEAITPISGPSSNSRGMTKYDFTSQQFPRTMMARQEAEYSMLDISDENFELDATRNLLEPKTPSGFTQHMTTLQCIPDEDPGLAATSSLFTDFKHCFQRHESASDVFDLLSSYEEVCSDHEALLRKILGVARPDPALNSVNLLAMVRDEKRTWRLIACLYNDRLKTEAMESSMVVDDMTEHTSEKKVVNNLFKDNADIRQAQIVIDWLERNAADDLDDEVVDKVQHYSENVCWENTLHFLSQRKLRGEKGTGDKHMVSQMDPDAPSRQRKPLADLDQSDEIRLLKSMFSFIRAGKIEKAQDLCMYCGQPWRVVSLDGWQLYHDSNRENLTEDGPGQIEGNPLRDLWKLASWSISQDETVHTFERAIYGSLCGNLKAMVNVCKSWEDYLWAHFKTMIDTVVEHDLRHSPTLVERVRPECAGGLVTLPESYWEQRVALSSSKQIFERIQAISNEAARQEGEFPFHLVQKYVILEDITGLIDACHSWVTESMEDDTESNVSNVHPQLLRFLCHLILFLRTIGVSMNESKCEVILEAFVRYLASEEKSFHLVANYTAALRSEKQIEVYSDFLKTIEDKERRQEYLKMAHEAGLDIPTITKTVVEDIRQQGDEDVTILTHSIVGGGDITMSNETFDPTFEPPMTRDDWRKIEALEWLVFDESQRAEAVKQCNALMRTFLAARKFTAAKEVFQKIPEGSIEVIHRQWKEKVPGSTPLPPDDENAIREYVCMQAYLSAKQSFMDWFKYYHHNKPVAPRDSQTGNDKRFPNRVAKGHREDKYQEELIRWNETCKKMCMTLRDRIYNVLLLPNGGWLIDIQQMEDNDNTRRRQHQLDVLRHLCLPALCHLLVTALKNTPDMKEECLHLADAIADEEYNVYEVFTKEEGRKLMSRIQDIAVDLL